jgi:hypothetical protein
MTFPRLLKLVQERTGVAKQLPRHPEQEASTRQNESAPGRRCHSSEQQMILTRLTALRKLGNASGCVSISGQFINVVGLQSRLESKNVHMRVYDSLT